MRRFAILLIACNICVCLMPLSTTTNAQSNYYEDKSTVLWSDLTEETNSDKDNDKETEAVETLPPLTTEPELNETMAPPCNHNFADFEVIKQPLLDEPGIELRKCTLCGYEDSRNFSCQHKELQEEITKDPGCQTPGAMLKRCCLCENVIEEVAVPATGHNYTEWQVVTYATPIMEGLHQKTCMICDIIVSESYSMTMAGDTAIYIPGTGINHEMTIAGFTQADVDAYNIVYSEEAYVINGEHDPFILGHNTRTMGMLPNTKIGQNIYISVNGEIETYKVIVSEYAIHGGYREMIGQTTGINLTDRVEQKALHLYTCYGSNERGRWIVLAVLTDE